MISGFLEYQRRYYETASAGAVNDPDHLLIEQMLDPGSDPIPARGYKSLYHRLVLVESKSRRSVDCDEVYRNNLKTLWLYARSLNDAIQKEKTDRGTAPPPQFPMQYPLSRSLLMRDLDQSREGATSFAQELIRSNAATVGSLRDGEIEGAVAPVAVENPPPSSQSVNVEKTRIMMDIDVTPWADLDQLIESAVINGSFLLIDDVLTLIAENQYHPIEHYPVVSTMHPQMWILDKIDSKFNYKELIRKNPYGDVASLKRACLEIEKLKLKIQRLYVRFGGAYPEERLVIKQVDGLWEEVLYHEPENRRLIQHIQDLNFFSKTDSSSTRNMVFGRLLREKNYEKLKALIESQVFQDWDVNLRIQNAIKAALEADALDLAHAKALADLRAGEGHIPDARTLERLFMALVLNNNLEVLQFIYELYARHGRPMPQEVIQSAYQAAKSQHLNHACLYLEPLLDKSSCCILM